ncbi:hypothetical protein [Actinomadura gamaensis]|uniref:Uncharacterized protein n=1 Tax=Actinomadura gamaensis TaxID=1763541 RepID=A0ABV9U8X3_9ACTN
MSHSDGVRRRRDKVPDVATFDVPRGSDELPDRTGAFRQDRMERLTTLGKALESTGNYSVRLLEHRAETPTLHVRRLGVARLSEDIGTEPGEDDVWYLTWSWGERVCRADDIETAMTSIGNVLTIRS